MDGTIIAQVLRKVRSSTLIQVFEAKFSGRKTSHCKDDVPLDMKERAFHICRDYLHGAWKYVSIKDLVIKHIRGGLSNVLYYCALPSSTRPVANEPSEVLVRFYGQVHGEDAIESLLAESVIFTLLSERRLGPKLYGVFPRGRIEQYIPARPLYTDELANPAISRQIAIRMARIHSMNVPISKEPNWIWKTMERWLKSSEDFLKKPPRNFTVSPSSSMTLERLKGGFSYREELEFMRQLAARTRSPVVFAHNDMQEGNILINKNVPSLSKSISLIDFEYCSYNYRAFDLANHFCEWMYSYKNPNFPFFDVNKDNYPTQEQQLNFIRAYLWSDDPSLQGEDVSTPPHPAEGDLVREVEAFRLTSHLFWTFWSIVQGYVSQIPFGYFEYALVRMEQYLEDKEKLSRK